MCPFHPAGRGKGNRAENMCFLSEFPFSSACRGKGTRAVQNSSFEPCDCHFPVPVEEKARAEKVGLSLGAGRGKGQRPAELKENPVLLDLTGKYGKGSCCFA